MVVVYMAIIFLVDYIFELIAIMIIGIRCGLHNMYDEVVEVQHLPWEDSLLHCVHCFDQKVYHILQSHCQD